MTILNTDTAGEMAHKIYNLFEIGQSCTVRGFVFLDNGEPVPKGVQVLKELNHLDMDENVYVAPNDRRPRRKRVKPPNTIGDFVAQKMFKFQESTRDGVIVYMIWRMQ